MLPPPGYFADSPWTDCQRCGTKVLKDSSRRCPRCGHRPARVDLVLGAGGGPPGLQLLSVWTLNPTTWTSLLEVGTTSSSHAAAADLRDNNDNTADTVSAAGVPPDLGLFQQDVTGNLELAVQYRPVGVIQRLSVYLRANLTGDLGPGAVINVFYDTASLPSDVLPDDYLSAASPFTPTWMHFDYTQDPRTSSTWDITRLTTRTWGFRHRLQTFTDTSSNTLRVIEFKVEVWGTPSA